MQQLISTRRVIRLVGSLALLVVVTLAVMTPSWRSAEASVGVCTGDDPCAPDLHACETWCAANLTGTAAAACVRDCIRAYRDCAIAACTP